LNVFMMLPCDYNDRYIIVSISSEPHAHTMSRVIARVRLSVLTCPICLIIVLIPISLNKFYTTKKCYVIDANQSKILYHPENKIGIVTICHY